MARVGVTGRFAALAVLGLAMNMEGGPCGDRGSPPVVVRNETDTHVFIKVVGLSGRERATSHAVGAGAESYWHQVASAGPSGTGRCTLVSSSLARRTAERSTG